MSPTIMLSEREWVALNVIAINDDTSVDDIIEEAIEAYVTRMCMNGSSIGEKASEALAGNYTRNDYEDEFGKPGVVLMCIKKAEYICEKCPRGPCAFMTIYDGTEENRISEEPIGCPKACSYPKWVCKMTESVF